MGPNKNTGVSCEGAPVRIAKLAMIQKGGKEREDALIAPTSASSSRKSGSQTNYFLEAFKMLSGLLLFGLFYWTIHAQDPSSNDTSSGDGGNRTCVVQPGRHGSDSAPAIMDAFKKCGHNGKVVFLNETYHVNSVMETTGLENVEVDVQGTLLVSQSIHFPPFHV
jgi:hypothetical protein